MGQGGEKLSLQVGARTSDFFSGHLRGLLSITLRRVPFASSVAIRSILPSSPCPNPMAAGYTCPVCEYPHLSEPPRSEFGGGSFEICPSCGFQFGVNDDDEGITYETWRRRWEAAGMPWSSVALKPPATWKPVARHVAPGGAALRRPAPAPGAESPAGAAAAQPTGARPAAASPSPKSVAESTNRKAAAKQPATAQPASKPAPGKAAARKPAPVKKTAAKPVTVTPAAAKKVAAKKAVAKKVVAQKAVAKKAVARKAPVKKAVAKKSPAGKASRR